MHKVSNFTPNLYPKHLLSQTTYIQLKYTIQIFIVSLIFIYMHIGKLITSCTYLQSKGHSTLSYIHLGKQLFILGEEFYDPYIYTYIYTPSESISHVTQVQSTNHGAAKILTSRSLFSCFSNFKTKFWVPSHEYVFLH